MMRHSLGKTVFVVLCIALPVRPQTNLVEVNSRKAAPDCSYGLERGHNQAVQSQRQGSVVGLLGYLVRGLQSRNSLVHGVPEEVQRERTVRCRRFRG